MIRQSLTAISIAALTGCANSPQVRALADSTGVYVSSLNEGTADFVERQSRLNSENEQHLKSFGAFTEANHSDIVRQHLAWADAGQQHRIDAFGRAAEVNAGAVVGRLDETSVKPAQLSFSGAGGYGEAASALSEISKGTTLLQAIKGLIEFGGEIVSSYQELDKAAAKTSEKSAADARTADESTLPQPKNGG